MTSDQMLQAALLGRSPTDRELILTELRRVVRNKRTVGLRVHRGDCYSMSQMSRIKTAVSQLVEGGLLQELTRGDVLVFRKTPHVHHSAAQTRLRHSFLFSVEHFPDAALPSDAGSAPSAAAE